MSKGVHDSSGCARHRSVYVYISVKGSRVCKHCNVLDVRKYGIRLHYLFSVEMTDIIKYSEM